MPPRLNLPERNTTTATDELWMRRALVLARRVPLWRTAPNPRVGCVIVKNGRLVAESAHARFGGPHAEPAALKKAGLDSRGATAYLTLEPCSHTGKKTPPCTQALIRAGIARVVVACTDENPQVNGRGIRSLRKAGIAVTKGILRAEAQELNRFFFHWVRTGRPFVTLKMASSLDGRITASSRWLSNAQALDFVQDLRAEHDAILVGKNTVLMDNPRLTLRKSGRAVKTQPLRVVLDSRLELGQHQKRLRILRNGPLLVACTPQASRQAKKTLEARGIRIWTSKKADAKGHVPVSELLAELGRLGIRSILIEGGAKTATTFLENKRVNEAWFILAPLLAGVGATPLYLGKEIRFRNADVQALDADVLLHVRFTADQRPAFKRLSTDRTRR